MPTAASSVYGRYSGTLAPGSDAVTVDWGDGTSERLGGFSQLVHTYEKEGAYMVFVSDDLSALGCSGPVGPLPHTRVYAKLLRKVVCNARRLKTLSAGAFRQSDNLVAADFSWSAVTALAGNVFYGCAALSGVLAFPEVADIAGSGTAQPFSGCVSLREIHFGAANGPAIAALDCYRDDPHLGAVNAKVVFDLK